MSIYNLCALEFDVAHHCRRSPLPTVISFAAGCDTGFGRVIAVTLRERGFNVFAGCLDPKSDGAEYLRPLGVHVLHVDYLKPDTVVNAYDKISDVLEGKGSLLIRNLEI